MKSVEEITKEVLLEEIAKQMQEPIKKALEEELRKAIMKDKLKNF